MTYSKENHLKLLKQYLDLQNQGKSLRIENPDKNSELTNYEISLYDWIFWTYKRNFSLVLENFISNPLNLEEFNDSFFKLWWDTMDKYKLFETDLKRIKEDVEFDPQSKKFGSRMSIIFRQLEQVEDENMTEQEFKDSVCSIYEEIILKELDDVIIKGHELSNRIKILVKYHEIQMHEINMKAVNKNRSIISRYRTLLVDYTTWKSRKAYFEITKRDFSNYLVTF